MRKRNQAGERAHGRVSKRAVRRLILLIVSSVVSVGLYRALVETPVGMYVFWTYLLGTSGLIFGYVIYNRGFSRRGVTRDMLSDSMSEEEKDEFLRSGEERMKRSAFMLIPIFAGALAILAEAIELIVIPTMRNIF